MNERKDILKEAIRETFFDVLLIASIAILIYDVISIIIYF